jgi:hypothetical protein
MKETDELLTTAKKIISNEHLSIAPKDNINAQVSKRLRKFFMSSCMAEIGTPFTSRIAGYMVKDL